MATADTIGRFEQRQQITKALAVEGDGFSPIETHGAPLALNRHIVTPKRHAHKRLHNVDAPVEKLQVLGFVSRAEQIRIGGVRFLGGQSVIQAGGLQIGGHFSAPPELLDEASIEPRLVNSQLRVGE